MKRRFTIFVSIGILLFGLFAFFKFSSIGTQALWNLSGNGKRLLPLVGVAALIDSVNPCAFSILILTIAFLFSIGRLHAGILKIGGSYIAGIFIVYMLIGLGILQVLHLFNVPHFMAKVGALVLVLLGVINLINEFSSSFPIKLRIPHVAHRKLAELMEKGSVPTAFLLGGLVGLCEFPCTGGPYMMVLGLLHDKATYINGLIYLAMYNLIFVLPLIIILMIAGDAGLIKKVQLWQQKEKRLMRLFGGVAMIILGVIIFFL